MRNFWTETLLHCIGRSPSPRSRLRCGLLLLQKLSSSFVDLLYFDLEHTPMVTRTFLVQARAALHTIANHTTVSTFQQDVGVS